MVLRIKFESARTTAADISAMSGGTEAKIWEGRTFPPSPVSVASYLRPADCYLHTVLSVRPYWSIPLQTSKSSLHFLEKKWPCGIEIGHPVRRHAFFTDALYLSVLLSFCSPTDTTRHAMLADGSVGSVTGFLLLD